MALPVRPRGVLFDLDGTLLDTAADLIAACHAAAAESGMQAVAADELRPCISGGASAMLARLLERQQAPTFRTDSSRMLESMLDHYQRNIAIHTRLFAGMEHVLDALQTRAIPWGIVTNKTERFTKPLLEALDFGHRPRCVISGDSLPQKKPHPLPMLEASRLLGCAPADCAYLGDSRVDIEAGRSAGMGTVAAAYGYVDGTDPAGSWGADAVIDHPLQFLDCLDGGRPVPW